MATPWTVPPLWRGMTVAVLASGPSLLASLQAVERAHRAGRLVAVATNSTGVATARSDGTVGPAAAPWADMLYGADAVWWRYHAAQALKFEGWKVTASQNEFRAVHYLRPTGLEGYDPTPGCIRTGGNSAYQAAHIAVQAGATRLLLCGLDLHANAGAHHHGEHPPALRTTTPQSFARMRERWGTLARPLRELGIEVFNCSPGSALTCFPQARAEEVA